MVSRVGTMGRCEFVVKAVPDDIGKADLRRSGRSMRQELLSG